MNNKDINELIAISYFDNDDLSIKEHCDIYFTIQKEVIHILNKYNINWDIGDIKSYKDKEIERLNKEKSILEKSLKLIWKKDIKIDYEELDKANKVIEKELKEGK